MNETVLMAFEIMWKGMVGIFVVIALLALVVYLLAKFGNR